jgi:hypothetical protein
MANDGSVTRAGWPTERFDVSTRIIDIDRGSPSTERNWSFEGSMAKPPDGDVT